MSESTMHSTATTKKENREETTGHYVLDLKGSEEIPTDVENTRISPYSGVERELDQTLAIGQPILSKCFGLGSSGFQYNSSSTVSSNLELNSALKYSDVDGECQTHSEVINTPREAQGEFGSLGKVIKPIDTNRLVSENNKQIRNTPAQEHPEDDSSAQHVRPPHHHSLFWLCLLTQVECGWVG